MIRRGEAASLWQREFRIIHICSSNLAFGPDKSCRFSRNGRRRGLVLPSSVALVVWTVPHLTFDASWAYAIKTSICPFFRNFPQNRQVEHIKVPKWEWTRIAAAGG